MELFEFNQSNHFERAAVVFESGQFLLIRHRLYYRIALYDMGKFFAETWYHSETNNMILVRGFKNITYLTPYLDLVDVSEITGY